MAALTAIAAYASLATGAIATQAGLAQTAGEEQQQRKDKKAVASQQAKELDKRKLGIDKQRKQLMGATGKKALNVNPTGATGVPTTLTGQELG